MVCTKMRKPHSATPLGTGRTPSKLGLLRRDRPKRLACGPSLALLHLLKLHLQHEALTSLETNSISGEGFAMLRGPRQLRVMLCNGNEKCTD
eukprot:4330338-Amphidinium_carterae.3